MDEITYQPVYFLRLIEVYVKCLKANPSRLIMRVGNIALSPVRKPHPQRGIWIRMSSTDPEIRKAIEHARLTHPTLNKVLYAKKKKITHVHHSS